jgi:hypothetical protein
MTLTPHDKALAARDPVLPGLALLLDTDRLAEALAPACRMPGWTSSCPPIALQAGTSCLAGSRPGRARASASTSRPRPTSPSASRSSAAAGQPEARLAPGPRGPSLDDHAILVRIVPYDRDLGALARLVEPESRRALLEKLVPIWRWPTGRRCATGRAGGISAS